MVLARFASRVPADCLSLSLAVLARLPALQYRPLLLLSTSHGTLGPSFRLVDGGRSDLSVCLSARGVTPSKCQISLLGAHDCRVLVAGLGASHRAVARLRASAAGICSDKAVYSPLAWVGGATDGSFPALRWRLPLAALDASHVTGFRDGLESRGSGGAFDAGRLGAGGLGCGFLVVYAD